MPESVALPANAEHALPGEFAIKPLNEPATHRLGDCELLNFDDCNRP